MKLLIAYDGSNCADAALKDLKRAGLPDTAEAMVLTVADVLLSPPIKERDEKFPFYVPAGIRRAHKLAAEALEEARGLAASAASRVRAALTASCSAASRRRWQPARPAPSKSCAGPDGARRERE